MKNILIILSATLLFACSQKAFNRIADYEKVLNKAQVDSLNALYQSHENLTSNQFLLITTPDIGDSENILEYAVKKGNELGVGQEDLDNGVIIIYSGAMRNTSIATGLGTELIVTDSIVQYVIDTHMIPFFKKGETFRGLYNGSKWITEFLEKPENKIKGANTK